jgi:hypothetical protein
MEECSSFLSDLNNQGLQSEINDIIKTHPRRSLGHDPHVFYTKRWSNVISYYTQDVLAHGGFRNIDHIIDYLNAYDQPISYLISLNINNMTNQSIIEVACYVYGVSMEYARQNNWTIDGNLSPKFLNFDTWAMQQIHSVRNDV